MTLYFLGRQISTFEVSGRPEREKKSRSGASTLASVRAKRKIAAHRARAREFSSALFYSVCNGKSIRAQAARAGPPRGRERRLPDSLARSVIRLSVSRTCGRPLTSLGIGSPSIQNGPSLRTNPRAQPPLTDAEDPALLEHTRHRTSG